MRKLILLFVTLMLISSIPAATAITVDGLVSPGEWNENWAFGQVNNATAAAQYDIFNTGDRLEIRQGAFGHDTNIWYAEDPEDDSYNSVTDGFDQTMSQYGGPSGSDILRIYGRYDPVTDTFYGLSTVYGIPGDLDGNGDTATNCVDFGDCNGAAGPVDSGIGPDEFWRIRISQGTAVAEIRVQDNNWNVVSGPLVYDDVVAKMDPSVGGVYEISVNRVSEIWDVSPCAPDLKVEVQSGGISDGPGEDCGTAFVRIPCPDIMIKKYVQGMDGVWYDAQTPSQGPVLANGSTVHWKYVIQNIGDEPLVNVAVTDDIIGLISSGISLDIGEEMTLFEDGQVPVACPYLDGNYYVNVGTVNGVGVVSGIPVTDNDPAHYVCEKTYVPVLTPTGMLVLIGTLGMIGIIGLRRRD